MNPDLAQITDYWQTALRLQDWRVQIEYVRDLSHRGAPVYGLCSALADNKTAQILIRDPATPVDGETRDPARVVEDTVVHELSHLWFAAAGTRTPVEVAWEENAVWAFSDALTAHRGTDQEQSIARAMVAHATVAHVLTRRAAPAARRQAMIDPILKAALQAAAGAEDPKAALDALMKAMDEGEPASERGEEQHAMGGEPDANKGGAPPAARRAPGHQPAKTAAAVTASGVTHRELHNILTERDERSRLMLANGDRMDEAARTFAADLDLPKLRKYVATLPARQAPSGTGGDAGGAVQPSIKDAKASAVADPKTAAAAPPDLLGLADLDEDARRRMRLFDKAADLKPTHIAAARDGMEKGTAGVLSIERIAEMKAAKAKAKAA